MTQYRTRDIVRQWHQQGLGASVIVAHLAAGFSNGSIPRDSNTHDWTDDVYARRTVAEGIRLGWINNPPTGKLRSQPRH